MFNKTHKLVAGLALGLASAAAQAAPINGAFSLSGSVVPLGSATINSATGLDFLTSSPTNCVGDIASIMSSGPAPNNCNGGVVSVLDFAAASLPLGPVPPAIAFGLPNWITLGFVADPKVTFSITSITEIVRSAGSGLIPARIDIVGTGIMRSSVAGFDDTIGGFALTANGANQSFSFSSTQISAGRVPEPGTLLLLGAGLMGLGFARRKLS